MTKTEMQARLRAVLAELDHKRERLLRTGVPKAMVPILLGVGIFGCSEAVYAAPCDGDCQSNWGGSGGNITSTGGMGGAGGHDEGGAGGVGGGLGDAGGVGGYQGGAGGVGGYQGGADSSRGSGG